MLHNILFIVLALPSQIVSHQSVVPEMRIFSSETEQHGTTKITVFLPKVGAFNSWRFQYDSIALRQVSRQPVCGKLQSEEQAIDYVFQIERQGEHRIFLDLFLDSSTQSTTLQGIVKSSKIPTNPIFSNMVGPLIGGVIAIFAFLLQSLVSERQKIQNSVAIFSALYTSSIRHIIYELEHAAPGSEVQMPIWLNTLTQVDVSLALRNPHVRNQTIALRDIIYNSHNGDSKAGIIAELKKLIG